MKVQKTINSDVQHISSSAMVNRAAEKNENLRCR